MEVMVFKVIKIMIMLLLLIKKMRKMVFRKGMMGI
jgi:hypothetical protein